MPILFISDIHLDPSHPILTNLFLNFLEKQAKTAKALYILGDLFEVWIGDDHVSEFNNKIIAALKEASAHTNIFIMPGNRDFLMGAQFANASGCQLLTEPSVIDLYGEKILLLHGDSLCTKDKTHQRFRKFVRHPLIKSLFLRLPLSWRIRIAKKLRNESKKSTQKKASYLMDINPDELPKLFDHYPVNQIIYGHTHRPSIQLVSLNTHTRYCYVLSDWGKEGNALVCEQSGEKKLVYFR